MTPPWQWSRLISTCCIAKTQHREPSRRLIDIVFPAGVLPAGNSMQKTHSSHAALPLTRSIALIYLYIIGGREMIRSKDERNKFRPNGQSVSCSPGFAWPLLLPGLADLEHDIVFLGHSSSQPLKDRSASLIEGGAILLPAPPFLLPFFRCRPSIQEHSRFMMGVMESVGTKILCLSSCPSRTSITLF